MKRLCVATLLLLPAFARADGVAQVLTTKSIPASTVAVIDPETGSSAGGGSTDVRIAPGDIIQFRFRYFPVPDNNGSLDGLAGYITEYIPKNTQIVGVRILSDDGASAVTIPPRWPGLAVDTSSGGSISHVYADTGVFVTESAELVRTPLDRFLALGNGTEVDPMQGANIATIVGADPQHIRAHNPWDVAQVGAYGGSGAPPFNQGSAVAGDGTFYKNAAGNVPGPWKRIVYPGSLIGFDPAGSGLRRTVLDASSLGFDLTPLSSTSSPAAAGTAVRIALGDIRVGRPGVAEVSLRVLGTPLDAGTGRMNADVDCAEIFGGDSSKRSDDINGPGASDSAWATFVPTPACVFLNLLFDLKINDYLALGGDVVQLTLRGKNLSIHPQDNVQVYFAYDASRGSVGTITPGGSTQVACPAAIANLGYTCRRWSLGTLAPSAEYTHTVNWTVGGGGQVTNVFRAVYVSDQLPGGYATQEIAMVQPTPVLAVAMTPQAAQVNPGADLTISGTMRNDGSGLGDIQKVKVHVPTGWEVRNLSLGGGITCAGPFTEEASCDGFGDLLPNGGTRAISFQVRPPADATSKLYPVHMSTWVKAVGFGGQAENFFTDAAIVAVGAPRSAAPVVSCPVKNGASSITGSTSEGSGTVIKVYFNGILRAQGTASGSSWSASGFLASFGPLYGGLEVRATATAPGELESPMSAPCIVTGVSACADGIDNDGDDKIDFPADPGCSSLADGSEDNGNIQCSDGIDNDGSGKTDYPNDPGCFGPTDTVEKAECADGVDNDGDGQTDGADGDCASAADFVEAPAPACANGIDDDGDGKLDFPADPGCHSANDASENDPNFTPIDVPPRLLMVIDTSGSMNYNVCADEPLEPAEFTGGDGTGECAGGDVSCATCNQPGCGNGQPDDSRLYKVKRGVANVVAAFGEVQFGLMRFRQNPIAFACPATALSPSGAWLGAGAAPCTGLAGGDAVVGFSVDDNRYDILGWLDGSDNYAGTGAAPPRLDFELRGTGTTPLAGSLGSALAYLTAARGSDTRAGCRPYKVILLTDGADTCGGNAPASAATLAAAGFQVYVIGFATTNQQIISDLNAIAAQGGTGTAFFVDDSDELSAAIAEIVADSILVEKCNGVDDNCNDLIDEAFPEKGQGCDNGQLGTCARAGEIVCTGDFTTACNAPDGSGSAMTEVCNLLDDNCNGQVDEDLTCAQCAPEVCNGRDDDCNGLIDDGDLPGVGDPCGVDTGECAFGQLECRGAQGLLCSGAIGPQPDVCDGKDNDCDGQIDGVAEVCYPAGVADCVPATPPLTGYVCQGVCAPGVRACTGGVPGTCGAVTPTAERCNGVDDDCDGTIDDGFDSGATCSVGIGACKTTGVVVCSADGMSAFCTAPIITGTREVCDGIDNDCDGEVDEGDLGAPIGQECGGQGGCGKGVFICDASGTIVCTGGGAGSAEVCDGVDNDCDGFIDEAPLPEMGDACAPPPFTLPLKGTCKPGALMCLPEAGGGAGMACVGFVGPQPEVCDGKDNDCDGTTDDLAVCPSPEEACLEGACVKPCGEGEFPCGFGFRCRTVPEANDGRYCLPYPCDFVTCPSGQTCNPETVTCEDPCARVTCDSPRRCVAGRCADCFTTGCETGQICRAGTGGAGVCVADPCANKVCGDGQFCRDGSCVALGCTPACAEGSVCIDGQCELKDCILATCNGRSCPPGQACNPSTGTCVDDPCALTSCPPGFECHVTCGAVAVCEALPAAPTVNVLATGGGGTSCAVGGEGQDPRALLLIALGLVVARRNRRRQQRQRAASSSRT